MKKKNKIRVNPVSIRNILTIRYDITEKPVKKPATIEDFKESLNDQDGYITEKLLSNSFRKIRKFNKFSISLSGGIDSGLCLALLRNNFPKAKIIAISGVFENAYDESTYAKKLAEKFDADFYLLQLGDYKVEGRLRSGDGVFTIATVENSIISETWHHLALTYDGSNIILYIDGIEAGSTEASGQVTNESVPLTIGRLVFENTNFDLDGQVDEVSIWNLALTEQAIQDYMYADLTGEAGLVGYWNFNEGSGETANDASGNENNGSIYGATWSTNVPFSGEVQCDSSEVELWGECYSIENTTVLDLNDSGLTGSIPPEIGNLENLTYLDLTSNDLTGSIPPEIGNLTNLTSLGLGGNNLTGSILSEIGNLINLTVLYLNNNQLTGEIPESICDLPEDCNIYLSNNQLCPPYPSCVEDYVGEQDITNCEQVSIADEVLPITYNLSNPYPNPFNPNTTIEFFVPNSKLVTVKVYDIIGDEINTIINNELFSGNHTINWNGSNEPNGVYFIRMESGRFMDMKKVILLK